LRFVHHAVVGELPPRAAAAASYREWWASRFGAEVDRAGLRAEANVLRYRAIGGVVVRAGTDTPAAAIELVRMAAAFTRVPCDVSVPPGAAAFDAAAEDDGVLAARIAGSGAERLRVLAPISDELAAACHAADIAVDDTAVTGHGRVELPCWVREQAIARTRHRHGRLPDLNGNSAPG
jgi:RHH-type proline utilization regulon transcriptional repressor/proline dehydrogenase/delta 1-pyrroline-5-carboxylate dehydrogenase